MIFLSVGSQLPFDRLVGYLDSWQSRGDQGYPCFGQIANGRSPSFPTVASLDLTDFRARVEACDVFVSHAGMGNIITALELGKPLVLVPRQASNGEHRNDHQIDTAARFGSYPGVFLAETEQEFARSMNGALQYGNVRVAHASPEKARLLVALRSFVRASPPAQ